MFYVPIQGEFFFFTMTSMEISKTEIEGKLNWENLAILLAQLNARFCSLQILFAD